MSKNHAAPNADPVPAALNIVAAAAHLSVSPDTIRRMIKNGVLAHARIGNSIRIRRVDLERYLELQTTTSWRPVDGRGQRAT